MVNLFWLKVVRATGFFSVDRRLEISNHDLIGDIRYY